MTWQPLGQQVAHFHMKISAKHSMNATAAATDAGASTMSNPDGFDFSKWDFPVERIWLHVSEGEMIWKICTFVPLILFGLYGNSIIIYLIAVNRSLRTPTNLIIANMAVADFLTLLICPGMFMISDFYQNYKLGSFGCKTEGFLVVLFLIAAVLNLSAVSYDRLTAIVLPTETRLTMRGAKIVIVFTWLAGICFALPLALYRNYKVRIWKNFTETYCKENTSILPKYWYVLITIMVWLPLGIMLICYSAIFYKLDRYERRVLKREHPMTVNYKKSVAKTLFIIVVVFVALRLPFTILVVLRDELITNDNTVDGGIQLFGYIAQYLMFLNAAVNPVIYGFNNDNFRRAYAQTTFLCCCKSMQQQSNKTANDKQQHRKPRKPHTCCYCKYVKKQQQAKQLPQNAQPTTDCLSCCLTQTNRDSITEPNELTEAQQITYKFYVNEEGIIFDSIDDDGYI